MTLKEVINEMSRTQADKYAERAVKLYDEIKDENELHEELIDLSYSFMEKILALTLEFIEDEYSISDANLAEKDLSKMFFSEDGKTMEDRIKEYITKDKVQFIYNICRFYTTEAQFAFNKFSFLILKDYFRSVKVDNLYCCDHCLDIIIQLSDWTPVEEVDLRDLPPYHPECVCVLLFSDRR